MGFTVPELFCPFPFTPPNPEHLEFARTELARWLDRFPLERRYLHAGGVELAAYTTPGPADPHLIALTAQFHTWLFATDDTYCDEARDPSGRAYLELLPRLLTVLDPPFNPAASPDPFIAGLADIRDRLLSSAPPRQVRRFADSMREALLSLAWELPVRAKSASLDLVGYRVLRRRNGAVFPCIELSALISDVHPEDHHLDHPAVRELIALAVDHIGIANDLWSYTKETRPTADIPTLMPHILIAEQGKTLNQAVAATADLCDELIATFEATARELEPTAPLQSLRYIEVLRAWIRGNLEWSRNCRRYNKPTGQY
ncbi:hypothetical protein OG696_00480 [Streptomyces sp. NBC_00656]|uniref:terpene synthase family protein n=1 Tax=Streptomyces sp. NBC_00656 TaxID=2903668 RepID=UPI003249EAB5